MKPGRLQNALKSFGRASKCFKILWPGFKIHQNKRIFCEFLRNSREMPRILEKCQEIPRIPLFFREFSRIFDDFTIFFGQRAKFQQKRCFFSPTQTRFFRRPSQGCRCNRPGQRHPCEGPPPHDSILPPPRWLL